MKKLSIEEIFHNNGGAKTKDIITFNPGTGERGIVTVDEKTLMPTTYPTPTEIKEIIASLAIQ